MKTNSSDKRSGPRLYRLQRPARDHGHGWRVPLPADVGPDDSVTAPERSTLMLFEDSRHLGPAHSVHEDIWSLGGGRFSHWGGSLLFSSSDNTSVATNGREYFAFVPGVEEADSTKAELIRLVQAAGDLSGNEQRLRLGERLFAELCPRYRLNELDRYFLFDDEFLRDYEKFDAENYRSFERKYVTYQLTRALNGIEGDTAECGVWRGASSFFIAKGLREMGLKKTHFMFDSFEGLSEPAEVDKGFWERGAMSHSEASVREAFESIPNVEIFKGWIPECFAPVSDRKFSMVHIDVDLYVPTHDSLEFFYPRMSESALILCDDYGFTVCPGARAAMEEFFADKPEMIVELPTGQGLVIRGRHS